MPRPRLAALAAALLALALLPAQGSRAAEAPPVGPQLFFHSAAGTYAEDAAADPQAAVDGRAPAGSEVTTARPTGDDPATATFAGANVTGGPLTPTFTLKTGVTGLKAVCYDVYLSADTPQLLGITMISAIETPAGKAIALSNLVEPAYDSGVVRVTGLSRPDIAGVAVPAGSTLRITSFVDGGEGTTLNYDATTVASSLQYNPATCAGKPVDYAAEAAAPVSSLPTVDRGLQFNAAVPSDPQRSLGEPAITVDKDGTLYTCGPSGFSNIAEYANVSTDGGDQFHLIGQPPRGQVSTAQGGGDCALGTAIQKNGDGNYTLAYAGLGPLDNFSTFTSPDRGVTITGSPVSESVPIVDRQWIAFSDDKTAFLNYNRLLQGQTVQKSTDGGLTYGPGVTVSTDGGRLGQIRAIPAGVVPGASGAVIYFPYSAGNTVKLAMSLNGGDTWSQCLAVDANVDPTAGFVTADHDSAGNIYVGYAEKGGGRDVYLVGLAASKVKDCKGTATDSALNKNNPGFSKKVRVNREGVETTVMPWVSANGAPGRVAVAYYGSRDQGNPDSGAFDATWHVFVSQSIDFFGARTFDQVQATTHPFHYDSICLAGLNCDIQMGDRSLVDYFTMEYNPGTGALSLVLSNASKLPDDAVGKTSTPTVLIQRSGPSNGGGFVKPKRDVVSTGGPDPTGDAIANYSSYSLASPVTQGTRASVPGLDLKSVSVGPEVDLETGEPVENGGFTVTMKYISLGDDALQDALVATQSTSLIFLFRYIDGYQQSSVGAYWNPGTGFRFGRDGYTETTIDTGAVTPNYNPGGEVRIYPGASPAEGFVDQDGGILKLSVPRSALKALRGEAKGSRPKEVGAAAGDRFYEAVAYTLANAAPLTETQSYLYTADSTPAFDFVLSGKPAVQSPQPVSGPSTRPGGGLAATGLGLALPLTGAALLLLVGFVRRRRRA